MAYKIPEHQKEYQKKWVAARRASFFQGKKCEMCTHPSEFVMRKDGKPLQKGYWSGSEQTRRNTPVISLCFRHFIILRHERLGYAAPFQGKAAALKRENARKRHGRKVKKVILKNQVREKAHELGFDFLIKD